MSGDKNLIKYGRGHGGDVAVDLRSTQHPKRVGSNPTGLSGVSSSVGRASGSTEGRVSNDVPVRIRMHLRVHGGTVDALGRFPLQERKPHGSRMEGSDSSRVDGERLKAAIRMSIAQSSVGQPVEVKIVRHYDPVQRDKMMAIYRDEPHLIDAALEVVNATTDLL